MCVSVYVCVNVCVCVYMYVCVGMCVCVCVYMCVKYVCGMWLSTCSCALFSWIVLRSYAEHSRCLTRLWHRALASALFKLTWLLLGGDPAARSHRVGQFTAL